MSIKTTYIQATVPYTKFVCDGPTHENTYYMDCDTITVEHGYGSPYDMETHHFCGIKCLKDWAENPPER